MLSGYGCICHLSSQNFCCSAASPVDFVRSFCLPPSPLPSPSHLLEHAMLDNVMLARIACQVVWLRVVKGAEGRLARRPERMQQTVRQVQSRNVKQTSGARRCTCPDNKSG